MRRNNTVLRVRRLLKLEMVGPQHRVQQVVHFLNPFPILIGPVHAFLPPAATAVIEMSSYVMTHEQEHFYKNIFLNLILIKNVTCLRNKNCG